MPPTPRPALNRLLAGLPPAEYRRLAPHLEAVRLAAGQVLYEPGEPIRQVYFPAGAVVSLLAVLPGGGTVEVASVGREGLVGLRGLLGAEAMPQRAAVLFPGAALRASADLLRRRADAGGPPARLLARYSGALLTHVLQLSACNALHPVGRRCCRWLLMARDRLGADELPLTHQSLAAALGVRRAGFTEVAGRLQAQGLIRCERGKVVVLDRRGLEAAACECHRAIRAEYERLLGRAAARDRTDAGQRLQG